MAKIVDPLLIDSDKLIEKLAEYNVSPAEAQELSQKFLGMSYRINRKLRDIKNEVIKNSILEKNAYKKAFQVIDNKLSVSKQKALASADMEYLKNSVILQKNVNDVDYWKGVYEVCNNAHIFYKQLCRD